jgi:hypothetical protein
MRFCLRVVTVIAVFGLAACPLSARAGTLPFIAGDLGSSNDGSYEVTPLTAWAQEFTTPTAVSFQSAYALLGNFDAGGFNFQLGATLVSTAAGDNPDNPIQTWTMTLNPMTAIPTLGNGFATVEYDLPTAITLSSSLAYWFILTGSAGQNNGNSGGVDWAWSNNPNVVGSLPATDSNNPTNWTTNYSPGFPFAFQAGGAIPEPGSMILGGVGFSAVLLAAFRSRARVRKAMTAGK